MASQFSHEELLHEALVLPMRSFVCLPDTRIIDRPGFLQVITPSLKQGGLNQVIFSVLKDEEAEEIIDQTIAEYQRHGIRFRWSVLPGSRPEDLGERLARRGLNPVEVRAMYRETRPAHSESSPDVHVEEVHEGIVDTFTEAICAGWGMDPTPLYAFHRDLLKRSERESRLFLGYYRGKPAGGACYTSFSRSIYMMGAAIAPEFRGKGIYRALVDARLKAASESGIPLATTQAQVRSSAPILERLGFETLCTFMVYGNRE